VWGGKETLNNMTTKRRHDLFHYKDRGHRRRVWGENLGDRGGEGEKKVKGVRTGKDIKGEHEGKRYPLVEAHLDFLSKRGPKKDP